MSDEVAVILSGCGVYDGTEIHEASAVCVALTRAGKKPVFYAPDATLYHEVNHVTSEADNDTTRNVLIESGRIARGKVANISVSTKHYMPQFCTAKTVLKLYIYFVCCHCPT